MKTMRIDIISVLPELFRGPFDHSILKRAAERNLAEIHVHDLRPYGLGKHKQVDDYQYGGGAGLVMMVEPLANCLDSLMAERTYDEIIFMCPDGEPYLQMHANHLSTMENLLIICGHYKGIDERIRTYYVTREISIGDYVITGGELAAMVVVDSIVRLIPGVINDEESALSDSFQDGLLAPPVYTRPAEFRGWKVPEILISGNFPKIDKWRMEQSLEKTKRIRPDLLEGDSEE